MEQLINEILGGLPLVQFIGAYFYACVGLALNMLRAAIARLTARRARKVKYNVFLCRAASSLLATFVIIIFSRELFGAVTPKFVAFLSGLVIDLAIQFLTTFASNFFINNQNTSEMNPEEVNTAAATEEPQDLEYVFTLKEGDKVNAPIPDEENGGMHMSFIPAEEYAQKSDAVYEALENGNVELIYYMPPLNPLEVNVVGNFVGHVPRPRKPR